MTVGGPEVSLDDGLSAEEAAKQPFTFQVFKVVVLAALGGFLFGYDTGIVSGAMIFVKGHFDLDDEWQEVVVSATILAAWLFSFVAGYIGDKYGRKKTVLTSSIIFTVGSLMMAAANNKYLLLLGRLTVGAGVGLSSMISPLYIAELAPSRIRGTLVTTNVLFITGGQAVSAIIAVGFAQLPENIGWRFMLGLGALPSIIQLIGFITLPESPRWLIRENRDAEAYKVLRKMRGKDTDIEKEYSKMRAGCNKSRRKSSVHPVELAAVAPVVPVHDESFWTVIMKVIDDKYLRKALALGCVLQAIQQLTGINTVMYYAATIIQMSGVEDKGTAIWMASITAVTNFLTTFIGLYAVDRLGRRKLCLISLFGVIISLILLSGGFLIERTSAPDVTIYSNKTVDEKCFAFKTCEACVISEDCGFCYDRLDDKRGTCLQKWDGDAKEHSMDGWCKHFNGTDEEHRRQKDYGRFEWSYDYCPSPYSMVVLFGLCLYILCFGPGMGPIPWTVNSEIFPLWARTQCLSCTTSVNWFCNMIVSLTFLTLVRYATKEGAFLIYGLLGVVGFIYLYICLPETKGKSLEEMESVFRNDAARGICCVSGRESSDEKQTTVNNNNNIHHYDSRFR